MNPIDKLRAFYMTYKVYINLIFSLITVAFFYALHRGDLKFLVEILKVASGFMQLLVGTM